MALTTDPSGTAALVMGVQNDIRHFDSPWHRRWVSRA